MSVLVCHELFARTLKIMNHRVLITNFAWQIRHAYNQERKLVLFVKNVIHKYIILNCYVQIQECCMLLYVPLDVQVLVLIDCGDIFVYLLGKDLQYRLPEDCCNNMKLLVAMMWI